MYQCKQLILSKYHHNLILFTSYKSSHSLITNDNDSYKYQHQNRELDNTETQVWLFTQVL